MKEVYSENPSGRIKGITKLSTLIAIIVLIAGFFITGPENVLKDLETSLENWAKQYEENYYGEYDTYYDDENELTEYLDEHNIETTSLRTYGLYETTGTHYFYKDAIKYQVDFSSATGKVIITNTNDTYETQTFQKKTYDKWSSVKVTGNVYGIILEITGLQYNTYIFLNNDLKVNLTLETPEEYGPVYGDDGSIYFGYETEDGTQIYKYNLITGDYTLMTN